MHSYDQAASYVGALTGGDPESVSVNFRAIHDTNRGVAAHSFDGTIRQCWNTLCSYQSNGYGIFINLNPTDGNGRELSNVAYIRAHIVDLDNISALQNFERASAWQPAPHIAVESSVGKRHAYWLVEPYTGNDYATSINRRLRQMFDGDRAVIDPTRVVRLPGSWHLKVPQAPHAVHWWGLNGYGTRVPIQTLDTALAGVALFDVDHTRKPLGDPDLTAPALEWVQRAMDLIDPNTLSRSEWLSTAAALKQSAWLHADEDTIRAMFMKWCAQFEGDDPAENRKLFDSVRSTELGWSSVLSRCGSLKALLALGGKSPVMPDTGAGEPTATPPMPPPLDCSGPILTHLEQQEYFAGCVAIEHSAEILVPSGRFMNASQFNMRYGGKSFIFTSEGKTTDEPWKAALRSQMWTVPKVDHTRFLPDLAFGQIVNDQLGRPGVNTYIPIKLDATPGDVTPFLRHMELMLPIEADRRQFIEYLAHGIKYPGEKIAWAPLIQSTEGVGKGFIAETIEHVIGQMYCYSPKAQELLKSGSTFNAWMRAKLFIVVNEVKVDEKRELIEILKPMISEPRIEVQSKGVDQEMEDNPSQWIFFSQWKDAIPVGANGRRYAIYYSAIQSKTDLESRGMDDAYFDYLFAWMKAKGHKHIAHYLLNYPIERGAISRRAPKTSSSDEAQRISRGPVERVIAEAVEDQLPGFRGGWLSSISIHKRIKDTGAVRGAGVSAATIETIASSMGYVALGRAPRAYFAEGQSSERAYLFAITATADPEMFGRAQGWE